MSETTQTNATEAEDKTGKYCPFDTRQNTEGACLGEKCQLWVKTNADPNEKFGCSFRFIHSIFIELLGAAYERGKK